MLTMYQTLQYRYTIARAKLFKTQEGTPLKKDYKTEANLTENKAIF